MRTKKYSRITVLRDTFFNIFATFSLSYLCRFLQNYSYAKAEFCSGASCTFETLLRVERMSKKQE